MAIPFSINVNPKLGLAVNFNSDHPQKLLISNDYLKSLSEEGKRNLVQRIVDWIKGWFSKYNLNQVKDLLDVICDKSARYDEKIGAFLALKDLAKEEDKQHFTLSLAEHNQTNLKIAGTKFELDIGFYPIQKSDVHLAKLELEHCISIQKRDHSPVQGEDNNPIIITGIAEVARSSVRMYLKDDFHIFLKEDSKTYPDNTDFEEQATVKEKQKELVREIFKERVLGKLSAYGKEYMAILCSQSLPIILFQSLTFRVLGQTQMHLQGQGDGMLEIEEVQDGMFKVDYTYFTPGKNVKSDRQELENYFGVGLEILEKDRKQKLYECCKYNVSFLVAKDKAVCIKFDFSGGDFEREVGPLYEHRLCGWA